MAETRGEPTVPRFVKHANGDIDLVGGVWPAWMHLDPVMLVEADTRFVRVEDGHVLFTVKNGSARYAISGVITKDGWPLLVLDRVG
jgi:hypothetical protein